MIRAAIDPGSARVGLVIVDHAPGPAPDAPALALLRHAVIPVGRLVDRAAPKIITRKDGSTYVLDKRREVTDDDVRTAAREVFVALVAHGVEVVALERVQHVYMGEGSPAASAKKAEGLLYSGRIGERIATLCEHVGIAVVAQQARSWRAALTRYCDACGESLGAITADHGAALDPLLRRHLPELYSADPPQGDSAADMADENEAAPTLPGFPLRLRRPSADLRDAAGLLLAAVLPCPPVARAATPARPRDPRAPRRPRSPGKPRDTRAPCACPPPPARFKGAPHFAACPRATPTAEQAAKQAAGRAATRARREAAGCTCPPSCHARECPLYAARGPYASR